MLGKILVVDQIATNRIAMRAKLGAAQFHVSQAASFQEALSVLSQSPPDLVVCDFDLPDGNAFDLIAQINKTVDRVRPPVIILCQGVPHDVRLNLLAAGANDVIEKPLDSTLLLARIRSHIRAAHSDAEWHLRDDTSRALGLAEPAQSFHHRDCIRIVGDNPRGLSALATSLSQELPDTNISLVAPDDVFVEGTETATDAYVLILTEKRVPEILRLLSTLRCHRDSRHAVVFVLQESGEDELAAYALDMGASDLVVAQTAPAEIALRLSTLLERKRQSDHLRATMRTGVEAAVCDSLTGLHNRRYALPHLARTVEHAHQTGKAVAVMIADLDHFKRINDTHGHSTGDTVIVEAAKRLRSNLRAVDLVARIGGEEFLVVLPNVTLKNAHKAAERLCTKIRETPFMNETSGQPILATISIGMTLFDPDAYHSRTLPTPEELLKQADLALYNAKEKGRNRVRLAKPAA